MNIEYIVSLFAFLVVGVVLLWFRKVSQKDVAENQAKGLLWLKFLRLYLSNVQKHRGLTTAYIKGNTSSLPDIEKLNNDVIENIRSIDEVGDWIINNERWTLIKNHWSRLETSFKENEDADNNLNQHNKLIKNTLYLLEEMADEHSLLLLSGDLSTNIEFLWKDLLKAIEYMGQARAVGSGVAAKGSCSSVERIRICYLRRKIEENGLSIIDCLPEAGMARQEVDLLLNCIDQNILGVRCNVSSSQFFDTATKTIEYLYEQYDITLAKIESLNLAR